MSRLITWINGSKLLPSQMNQVQDDYEYGPLLYRTVLRAHAVLQNADGSGLKVMNKAPNPGAAAPVGSTATLRDYAHGLPILAASGDRRTPMGRLQVWEATNVVSPATTFTYDLRPVTAVTGGTSGNQPSISTLGSAVLSTPHTPGASAQAQLASTSEVSMTAFAFTTGLVALCVTLGGTIPSGGIAYVEAHLQVRLLAP